MILTNKLEQAIAQGDAELVRFLKESIDDFIGSEEYQGMKKRESYIDDTHDYDIRQVVRVPDGFDADGNQTYKPAIEVKPLVTLYSDFARRGLNQLTNRLWSIPFKTEYLDRLDADIMTKGAEMSVLAGKHDKCYALQVQGVMTAFKATEFIEVLDGKTGKMTHGVRFYKIIEDDKAPMIIELYDNNGYITWVCDDEEGSFSVGEFTPYASRRSVNREGLVIEELGASEGYTRLPIAKMSRRRLLTRSVMNDIEMYDRTDTLWHDEHHKTHNFYWTIAGYGGNFEDLMAIRDTINATKIIAPEGDGLNKADAKLQRVDFPFEANREALNRLENNIYKKMEVTNISAITIGNVTATAIKMAFEAEVNRVGELERENKRFIAELLEIEGIEVSPDEIEFSINLIHDEVVAMQALKIAYDIEVPPEVLWRKIPSMTQSDLEEAERLRKSDILGADVDIEAEETDE